MVQGRHPVEEVGRADLSGPIPLHRSIDARRRRCRVGIGVTETRHDVAMTHDREQLFEILGLGRQGHGPHGPTRGVTHGFEQIRITGNDRRRILGTAADAVDERPLEVDTQKFSAFDQIGEHRCLSHQICARCGDQAGQHSGRAVLAMVRRRAARSIGVGVRETSTRGAVAVDIDQAGHDHRVGAFRNDDDGCGRHIVRSRADPTDLFAVHDDDSVVNLPGRRSDHSSPQYDRIADSSRA